MKTKLILNSGGIRNNLKLRKKFHQEMIRGFSESQINILICSFAQPREYWEQKFSGYSASIKEDLPEHLKSRLKKLILSISTEGTTIFLAIGWISLSLVFLTTRF